jgi:recombination protein RecR
MEAETTASYIKNLLARQFSDIRLSRLAQGMPLGAEVKYMDRETLKQSLAHRQDF